MELILFKSADCPVLSMVLKDNIFCSKVVHYDLFQNIV